MSASVFYSLLSLFDKHYTRLGVVCQIKSFSFSKKFRGYINSNPAPEGTGLTVRRRASSTFGGWKKCEKSRKKLKITLDFTNLHWFWGEIWAARGGWGEKMRKNVRKKTKYAHKCAQMRTKDTWQDQKWTQIDG